MEFDKKIAAVGLGVVIIVMLAISSLPNTPDNGYDPATYEIVTAHGAVTLYRDATSGEIISEKETLSASDSLVVKWEADVSTSDINAYLYAVSGVQIEKGAHTQNGTIHLFSFTLDGAPEGLTECYILFGGQYTSVKPWIGTSVSFFIEQSSTPEYPEPEFTEIPDVETAFAGIDVLFSWEVIYTGPCVARFTIDGVTQASKSMIPTSEAQPLSFVYAFNEKGIHKAKLILEPQYDIAYASEITVDVLIPTNTTITNSTSAITSTTTSTTEPTDEGFVISIEAIVAVVIIVIVIIIIIVREFMKED